MLFNPIAPARLHLKEQVTESAADRQRQSDRPIDCGREVALSGFTQVRKNHGHEQEGFESLAQYDDERLKHDQDFALGLFSRRGGVNGQFAVCPKLKMIVNIGLGRFRSSTVREGYANSELMRALPYGRASETRCGIIQRAGRRLS